MPRTTDPHNPQERVTLVPEENPRRGCQEKACRGRRWRACGRPGCLGRAPYPLAGLRVQR